MVSEALPIKKAAVTRLNSALLGLFLLIVSWLILSTINPQLTVFSNVLNPTPDLILANPTQQTSSDPVVVSNGGVQTLTSPTTDAAIKAAQNSTDPTVQAAAADAVKKLDATCASTYRGDIAPAGNPCTQGSSQQFLGTKVYTACATITTVTGTQSCFYNP